MYSSGRVSWTVRAWFWASVILNGLSLGAFLEQFFIVPSVLSAVLHFEQRVFEFIWRGLGIPPTVTGTRIIALLGQVLVFMGGIYAAANYYSLRTEGQSVIQRIHDTDCRRGKFPWICAVAKSFGLYLAGPVLLPIVLLKACLHQAPTQRIWGFTFRPSHVAAYYGVLVVGVVVTLATASYLYSGIG